MSKDVTIKINRLDFGIQAGETAGAALRYLPTPPLTDEHDLYRAMAPAAPDLLVRDSDTIEIKGGEVFYSTPKFINPGTDHE